MISSVSLFLACAYAAVMTLLLAAYSKRIAGWLDLFDRPGGLKKHRDPTPLMGGVALIVVLVPILIAYMLSYEPEGIGHWALSSFAAAMLGCALIGTIDDHKPLSARIRFLGTLVIFWGLLLIEPRFMLGELYFTGSESPVPLGYLGGTAFTLFTLLGFLNAVNMADGKNGLVMGLSGIWALILAVVGPPGIIPVMLPLAVMLFVLGGFNLAGKLFLGDGGTYGLAAILSLAATYSYNFHGGSLKADGLILLFLIPVMDMMRLIAARLADGRSPMSGDRDHLHHYLLSAAGWPGGLAIYLLMVLLPNWLGVIRPDLVPLLIGLSMLFYFLIIVRCRPANVAGETQATPAE